MAMNYALREATPADVNTIDQLVNSAYRGESSKAGWTTEADILGGLRIDSRRLLEVIADPTQKILCLDNEAGELVSVVNLKRFEDKKGVGCYLGMMTVKPTVQAGGIGKIMMTESEKVARAWGATRMSLTVIQVRAELIEWYKRRGYEATGATEDFPYGDERFGEPKRDDLHFLVFDKPL